MLTLTSSVVVLAALANLVSTNPVPAPVNPSLVRRQEGLHLANCLNNGARQSYMLYYSNDGGSPSDYAFIYASGGWITWEGQSVSGTFVGSGAGATSNIGSGSHASYQYAGSASNSYGQQFNCYRDDGHQLTTNYPHSNTNCNSIYYCLDA